jgi:hypothetical protein
VHPILNFSGFTVKARNFNEASKLFENTSLSEIMDAIDLDVADMDISVCVRDENGDDEFKRDNEDEFYWLDRVKDDDTIVRQLPGEAYWSEIQALKDWTPDKPLPDEPEKTEGRDYFWTH